LKLRSVIAALPAALLLAGCGGTGITSNADAGAGKNLFEQKCGSCHALADAGTKGAVGPDLDAAFLRSREDGLGESSFREVTRGQIEYALPPMPRREDLDLSDKQADSIAAYVASVAGVEGKGGATASGGGTTGGSDTDTDADAVPTTGGAEAAGAEGKSIFTSAGCVSCHTLADAGATGTIGPNLDEEKPSEELAVDRVTHGKGAMPPFKGQLTDAQIQAVAKYVATAAGK
jgi:mono/diheme cytochrome c family protein